MSSLASTSWGSGPLVVLCHGFTQNSGAWGEFGSLMGTQRTILAVDLPGHGHSSHITGDLDDAADEILALVGGEPFDLIGYSMGGRVSLTMALRNPPGLGAVALIGATAGLESPGRRAERREADERLAQRLERDGVDEFVTWWLTQPLFASLSAEASALEARRANQAAGLAASLRSMGTGTQHPSWDRLHTIQAPALFVAGAVDPRFIANGRRMMAAVPRGTLIVVAEAGHACHLESPSVTSTAIESWLTATHH